MKFRGALFGLDAQSGKVKWRLETTKVGEMMFGAGAAVWSSTAIDEKLGLAFIGTGNSYYAPASPLSDSLLAVDYKTGELQWVHQFTANDNFTAGDPMGPDSDVGAAPNLFTINGKDFVGVGDKAGSYYAFVRDTGEPAWSKKLTFGGSAGGVMGTAATAYDTIFVISNQNFREAHIFALRADSGVELWKKVYPGMTFGHPVVVGDLLFATTTNISGASTTKPKMFALSVDDGKEDWAHTLPNSAAGGASVVGSRLLTGYGFHFFDDRKEPLSGGLAVFNIGDMGEPDTDAGVESGSARSMAPTFDAVYREVLEPSGCTTTYCHGCGGNLAMMDRATAYDNLVNAAADGKLCAKSGLRRVTPGKPNESLLYVKLLENPPCGVRMPVAGKLPLADIEQIKAWITLGAMND
jgi:outer membrane protein assembly factor BamB